MNPRSIVIRFTAALVLIPLADQAVKILLRRRLGTGSVSLGPLGSLRVIEARIWLSRSRHHLAVTAIWFVWLLAAVGLQAMAFWIPGCEWFAGLLVGGSLSHALEMTIRGRVSDYVCLRFWPAFNLADVAITVGAIGVVWETLVAIRHLMR